MSMQQKILMPTYISYIVLKTNSIICLMSNNHVNLELDVQVGILAKATLAGYLGNYSGNMRISLRFRTLAVTRHIMMSHRYYETRD